MVKTQKTKGFTTICIFLVIIGLIILYNFVNHKITEGATNLFGVPCAFETISDSPGSEKGWVSSPESYITCHSDKSNKLLPDARIIQNDSDPPEQNDSNED